MQLDSLRGSVETCAVDTCFSLPSCLLIWLCLLDSALCAEHLLLLAGANFMFAYSCQILGDFGFPPECGFVLSFQASL